MKTLLAFLLLASSSIAQPYAVWEHDGLDIEGNPVNWGNVFYHLIPETSPGEVANSVKTTMIDMRTTPSLPVTPPDYRKDPLDMAGVPSGNYYVGIVAESATGTPAQIVYSPIFTYMAPPPPPPPEPGAPVSFTGWRDTKASNSMEIDDTLFNVTTTDGIETLHTVNGGTNIHSHDNLAPVTGDHVFTGELMKAESGSSIGVTFFSQYTDSDHYYRLRSQSGGSFNISPHATSVTGDKDAGVSPIPGAWYQFKIDVTVTATETQIRAKVWQKGSVEPPDWQINCVDASASRLDSGHMGVWAMGTGDRYWRTFEIGGQAPPPPPPDTTPPSDPQNVLFRKEA